LGQRRADLILSGHTHGGQIRLPLVGAIIHGTKFVRGLVMGWYEGEKLSKKAGHDVGKSRLYVSRGLGTSRFSGRLLCRPELAVFTLRKKA
jgi:predicted MPP superfamily phosphohydrolase